MNPSDSWLWSKEMALYASSVFVFATIVAVVSVLPAVYVYRLLLPAHLVASTAGFAVHTTIMYGGYRLLSPVHNRVIEYFNAKPQKNIVPNEPNN